MYFLHIPDNSRCKSFSVPLFHRRNASFIRSFDYLISQLSDYCPNMMLTRAVTSDTFTSPSSFTSPFLKAGFFDR